MKLASYILSLVNDILSIKWGVTVNVGYANNKSLKIIYVFCYVIIN